MTKDSAAELRESIYRVHRGDARDTGRFLDEALGDAKVTTTITSPPYAWLKNYGTPTQIGHGQDLPTYLDECSRIFGALAERTSAEGSLWIVADSLVDQNEPTSRLLPLPFMLADAAAQSGWVLRDVITWQRDKGMPWSGRGRLRNAFEYVMHLVLSDEFKYNLSELRDFTDASRWWVRFPERFHPEGPMTTNVWDIPIPTQGSWSRSKASHVCPLPTELIDRIVHLSTDPGDVVFDPFAGIGSVVSQANRAGRRGLGLEINPVYVETFETGFAEHSADHRVVAAAKTGVATPDLIMNLRALKHARTLVEQIRRADPTLPRIFAALVVPGRAKRGPNGQWRIPVTTTLAVAESPAVRGRVERLADAVSRRRPLSKFGVDCQVRVVSPYQLMVVANRRTDRLWLYPRGRTWRYETMLPRLHRSDLVGWQSADLRLPHVLATVPIWLEE